MHCSLFHNSARVVLRRGGGGGCSTLRLTASKPAAVISQTLLSILRRATNGVSRPFTSSSSSSSSPSSSSSSSSTTTAAAANNVTAHDTSWSRNSSDGTSTAAPAADATKAATLWCQGVGLYGALGLGKLVDSVEHFEAHPCNNSGGSNNSSGSIDKEVFRKVSAGWGHSVFLDSEGEAHITGRSYDFRRLLKQHKLGKFIFRIANMFGSSELGHKDFRLDNIVLKPTRLGFLEALEPIVDVKCSAGGSILRSKSGGLYFVGDNYSGQSGITPPSDRDTLFWPEKVLALARENIVDFDFGYSHVLACNSNGELYCWGRNSYGQLGDPELVDFSSTPTKVIVSTGKKPSSSTSSSSNPGAKKGKSSAPYVVHKVAKVTAGFAHSFVLTESGEVFGMGRNMAANLRTNKVRPEEFVYDNEFLPRKIAFPDIATKIVDMASSNYSTVFACDKGKLFVIGMDESRQVMCLMPIPVERPRLEKDNNSSNNNSINSNSNSSNSSSNSYGKTYDGSSMDNNSSEGDQLIRVDEIRKPHMKKDYHNLRVNGVISFAVSKILNDSNSFAKRSADDIKTEYAQLLQSAEPVVLDRKLCERWELRKGMHRVAIINDMSQGALVSEVVIHEGRAYLVPSSLCLKMGEKDDNDNIDRSSTSGHEQTSKSLVDLATSSDAYKVLDYSQGWQHSLIVIEPRN